MRPCSSVLQRDIQSIVWQTYLQLGKLLLWVCHQLLQDLARRLLVPIPTQLSQELTAVICPSKVSPLSAPLFPLYTGGGQQLSCEDRRRHPPSTSLQSATSSSLIGDPAPDAGSGVAALWMPPPSLSFSSPNFRVWRVSA